MRLPRIKSVHNPVRFANGIIVIGTVQYGIGSELRDDPDGMVWKLLGLLDGTRTVDAIVAQMARDIRGLDPNSVREALAALSNAGFVEDAGAGIPESLGKHESERYATNIRYFAWVDDQPRESPYELQRRLKEARVTVLGLGGTGCAVAMSLVAAGVGAVRCVDHDVIEASNLSRQLLYTEDDIGLLKSEAAVRRLRRLNPHVAVEGVALHVRATEDVVALMQGCDLLILCADQPYPDIQLWTNEAALRTATPWTICLYAGPMIVTGIFVPRETPCFRCHIETEPTLLASERWGRGEELLAAAGNAVIAPSANLTGHWGALDAIYFLTGLKAQTVGRVFHQNLMLYDHHYYIEPSFWRDCPACGPHELGARAIAAITTSP